MEQFRQKGLSMAPWSTFIFKSACDLVLVLDWAGQHSSASPGQAVPSCPPTACSPGSAQVNTSHPRWASTRHCMWTNKSLRDNPNSAQSCWALDKHDTFIFNLLKHSQTIDRIWLLCKALFCSAMRRVMSSQKVTTLCCLWSGSREVSNDLPCRQNDSQDAHLPWG